MKTTTTPTVWRKKQSRSLLWWFSSTYPPLGLDFMAHTNIARHCARGRKPNGHHEWRKLWNFNTFHFYYCVVVVVSGCHCRFAIISARCCTWILGIRAAFPLSGLLQLGNGADDADDDDDHRDRSKLLNAFNWTRKNYGNEGVRPSGIQRSDWHSGWYRR